MKWTQLQPENKKKLMHWFLFIVVTSVVFLSTVVYHMRSERNTISSDYERALVSDEKAEALKEKLSANAVKVTTGTYVETIKEISLKSSNFRLSFIAWFRWNGNDELDFTKDGSIRVYNGVTNKTEIIKNYHENGEHYQEMRLDVTVSKAFNTSRFPLGSQILKFYIEPNQYTVDEVVFLPDTKNSGVNSNLSISGYELVRHDIADHTISYPNTMNNPRFENPRVSSEIMTVLEVARTGWGLYMKCFIALIGTSVWVLIALYICANHKVNPLGTMASALFGTVSNLMVGANLLPDVVQLGLAEYVNVYGIMLILAGTISIININRIRESKQDAAFAKFFGRVMFYTILVLYVAGQIIMPMSACL